MIPKNVDIRNAIKNADVRYWQIAERLGMHEGNFSCRLRRELPNESKRKILAIIQDLEKENKEESMR